MSLHEAERRARQRAESRANPQQSNPIRSLQRKATRTRRKATSTKRNTSNEPDALVPDPVAREEVGGISRMSAWRYDRSEKMRKLGWPPRIELNGRIYRSRKALEAFKANLMARAIAARGKVA
jgi:hypothetical protein